MTPLTKIEFEKFIDSRLALTTHGFGVDSSKYTVEEEHENLKDHYEAFLACCDMLVSNYKQSKKKQDMLSSYALKHAAERYATDIMKQHVYVPEGTLIAAVIHLGLPFERHGKTTGIKVQVKKVH
jgi:hypothetical protein